MPQPVLNARALKCTDRLRLGRSSCPTASRAPSSPFLPDGRVIADLKAKFVRTAVAAIGEHGLDGVAVIPGKWSATRRHHHRGRRAAVGAVRGRGGGVPRSSRRP